MTSHINQAKNILSINLFEFYSVYIILKKMTFQPSFKILLLIIHFLLHSNNSHTILNNLLTIYSAKQYFQTSLVYRTYIPKIDSILLCLEAHQHFSPLYRALARQLP